MNPQILVTLGLIILLISCGNKYHHVEERNVSGYFLRSYYIDEDSLRQGEYISYYDENQIFERSNYKDDLLEGKRFIYFEDGQIEIEENYLAGVLHDSFFV